MSANVAVLTVCVAVVACGSQSGVDPAVRDSFLTSCRSAPLASTAGWEEPVLSGFSAATMRMLENGVLESKGEVSGRSRTGQRQSATVTCQASRGEESAPRLSFSEPKVAPLTDADLQWAHDTILRKANQAAEQRHDQEAADLLEGKGEISIDTRTWLAHDPQFKVLHARMVSGAARARALEAKARLAADIVAARADATARREYAESLRSHFLDQNLNIKVSVSGRLADQMTLTYALFDEVWIHKFQRGDLIQEIRGKGFKVVRFDDGWNFSWRLRLE